MAEGRRLQAEGRVRAKEEFIRGYMVYGTVRNGCKAAKISRGTYYNWLESDKDFSEKVADAKQEFGEYLEGIALERVKNPDKGKGSDVLLIFLLNGTMPWKYRPQIAISEDSAKDLILEWRKAAQDVKAEAVSEPLPAGVEQTLTELLDKRGSAPVKDEETERGEL